MIPVWTAKLGMTEALQLSLQQILCSTRFKFVVYYEGTRHVMAKGTLLGMTLSGISTQTTGGNTVREIIKQKILFHIMGLDEGWISYHAGDDTIVMVEREHVGSYLNVL